jgi:hypothetical protein
MRLPRRTRSVPRTDAATRMSPFGVVFLVLIAACFGVAMVTGAPLWVAIAVLGLALALAAATSWY